MPNETIAQTTVTLQYDAIGNILQDGYWQYTWQSGRQLKAMQHGEAEDADYERLDFAYNADGLRVQKCYTRHDGEGMQRTVTDYILHGKNIVHMRAMKSETVTDEMHFFYDAQSKPSIVEHTVYAGGTPTTASYTYVYNLQGNVVALLNSSATAIVTYAYDAWGRMLSITGTKAETLGLLQPFRYRGYVYDEETGLFYLRSRYYNPTWGRFINVDSSLSQFKKLIGTNLYTYCLNCPTLYHDSTGNEAEECIDITQRLNDEMRAAYIEISLIASASSVVALGIFVNNVKSGGKWDLKRREDWNLKYGKIYVYDGIKLEYDEPGNIMFGYVGSALFNLVALKAGAGLYQQYENHSKDEWGKWWPNFGDEPKDSAAIEYGYRLKKKFEFHLSIPTILFNLIKFNQYNEEFRRNHELAK